MPPSHPKSSTYLQLEDAGVEYEAAADAVAAFLAEPLAEVLGKAPEVSLVHLGGQMLPRTWSQVTTTWSQVTNPWKKANIDQQSTAYTTVSWTGFV